jgi:heavy metal sensor kinase
MAIKLRLAAWYFVIMAVAMTALGWLALAGMKHSIRSTVDEQLAARIEMIKRRMAALPPTELPARMAAELREELGPDSEEEIVQISDEAGNRIFQSSWLMNRTLISAAAAAEVEKKRKPFFDAEVGGEPYRGMSATLAAGTHTYSIQVAQDMDDFAEATARFRHLLLLVIPALLLAASLGGYWISRKALAPVDAMTRAAREISGRNLSARLAVPETDDELARLAETLNAMLERLALSLKQITQFTADASHELRTPIALMRTRAEIALRRPRSAQENQETIEQLYAETVRTSELVERLMLLARADSGARVLRAEPVELVQLLREVLEQTAVLAEHKQLTVEARLESTPVWVEGDAQLLRQLTVILVDNAVKYTPAPGKIVVALCAVNGVATVAVSDTGIGIEGDDLEKIFERFNRADKARSRETGGVGLGLSIGRWIAESHGGTLTAESKPGTGSTFVVRLPGKGGHPGGTKP